MGDHDPTDRRLQVSEAPNECIEGLHEDDNGYSWAKLLRFLPIQFSAGGRFRLCFCDHTLTTEGECMNAEDYDLDLGYVMASGVTCFFDQSRYKRDMYCISMYHGGQRCYDKPMDAPDLGIPRQQTLREVNYKALIAEKNLPCSNAAQRRCAAKLRLRCKTQPAALFHFSHLPTFLIPTFFLPFRFFPLRVRCPAGCRVARCGVAWSHFCG